MTPNKKLDEVLGTIVSNVKQEENEFRTRIFTGSDFASVYHDEQLHQVVVDLAAAGLDDVDVLATNRFTDFNAKTVVSS